MNDQCSQKKLEFCVLIQGVRIKIRTDFIRAVIIDTLRFFMIWIGIALMTSLFNEFSNHTLQSILIDCRQKFDFWKFSRRNCSFPEFHFAYSRWKYVNSHLCKGVYVTKHHFSYPGCSYKYQPSSIWSVYFHYNISLNMNAWIWEL